MTSVLRITAAASALPRTVARYSSYTQRPSRQEECAKNLANPTNPAIVFKCARTATLSLQSAAWYTTCLPLHRDTTNAPLFECYAFCWISFAANTFTSIVIYECLNFDFGNLRSSPIVCIKMGNYVATTGQPDDNKVSVEMIFELFY